MAVPAETQPTDHVVYSATDATQNHSKASSSAILNPSTEAMDGFHNIRQFQCADSEKSALIVFTPFSITVSYIMWLSRLNGVSRLAGAE